MTEKKVPSLVDLCVKVAVDNVRYLGDVGLTDDHLLKQILPHCTLRQLIRIENSTGRDLSSVTDNVWKKFHELTFGAEKEQKSLTWKQSYKAKLKELEKARQKTVDKLKESYKKEDERKQSRKIQLCTKVPPSSNKRSFWGGGGTGLSNMKSGLMKKAKLEFINCREVKNLAAMKKNSLPRNRGVVLDQKAVGFSGKGSASVSRFTRPGMRRVY